MAFLTKLNIAALVLMILLSFYGALCTSASSLHQRDQKQNSRWFSDCRIGYRKLGNLNCESADVLTNMKRTPVSQILKKALSPPPAPIKRVAKRLRNITPPPPPDI